MGNEQSSNLACCSCSDSKAWRGADMEDFRPMFKNKKLGTLAEDNDQDKERSKKERSAERRGEKDRTAKGRKEGEGTETKAKTVTKWTSYGGNKEEQDEKPQQKRSPPEKYATIKYAAQPWQQEWELVEQMRQQKLEEGAQVAGSSPLAMLPAPPPPAEEEREDAYDEHKVGMTPMTPRVKALSSPQNRHSTGSNGSVRSMSGSAKEIKGVLRTPRDGSKAPKTPRSARGEERRGSALSADVEDNWTPHRVSVRFVKEAQIVTKSRNST